MTPRLHDTSRLGRNTNTRQCIGCWICSPFDCGFFHNQSQQTQVINSNKRNSMNIRMKTVHRTTLQNVVGVVMVLSGGIGMVASVLWMFTQ